jgi:hypothetical protein
MQRHQEEDTALSFVILGGRNPLPVNYSALQDRSTILDKNHHLVQTSIEPIRSRFSHFVRVNNEDNMQRKTPVSTKLNRYAKIFYYATCQPNQPMISNA